MVCGRSREITGPYVDANGRSMLEGGGSIVIQGDERFKGTGHNAFLREGDRDYLVYHAYDAEHDGKPDLANFTHLLDAGRLAARTTLGASE